MTKSSVKIAREKKNEKWPLRWKGGWYVIAVVTQCHESTIAANIEVETLIFTPFCWWCCTVCTTNTYKNHHIAHHNAISKQKRDVNHFAYWSYFILQLPSSVLPVSPNAAVVTPSATALTDSLSNNLFECNQKLKSFFPSPFRSCEISQMKWPKKRLRISFYIFNEKKNTELLNVGKTESKLAKQKQKSFLKKSRRHSVNPE